VIGGRGKDDDREGPVVAAEGVEPHVAEVAARVEDRGIEVLGALGELEVAAVVHRPGIGWLPFRPWPARRAAVSPQGVDDEVAANRVLTLQGDPGGARRAVPRGQQSTDPDPGPELDRRLGGGGPPERPLDHRTAGPEVDEILVSRLPLPVELLGKVLRLGTGREERVEDVRRPLPELTATAWQEGVRLEVVRDPLAIEREGALGRCLRIDWITLEDDRLVTRPRDGKRGRKPCDAAPGDDEPHAGRLSG
jgi:hypothetical protein